MKTQEIMKKNTTPRFSPYKQLTTVAFTLLLMFLLPQLASATIKTSAATGNWGAAGTWSPSGIPGSGDTVIINGGHTITVNGAYTCKNLDLGNATAGATTLTVTVGNSLTISSAVRINPNNVANTYVLDAGAGTLNVQGTLAWSTTGTNSIRTAAGTLNITPAITIASANQNVTFTGAGTINFANTFTDSYNKLTTFAGCTVNFSKSYVVNTTAATWAGRGTAVFAGSGFSITPTSSLTLFNVQFTGNTTLNSGAGTVVVGGDLTIGSGVTFTSNKDFDINGNWTNNGGTFSGAGTTVAFNGGTKTIGGTANTAFGTLQFGSALAAVTQSVTINRSATCTSLIVHGGANARTVTLPVGDTLTVNGNATINQPTAAVTNSLSVGAGVCNITGDLTFAGTNSTATFIGRVAVTTGSFTVAGNVNWMSNSAVATEVISVTTGNLTFGSSVTMGSNSGTITATGAATIRFNGTTAPSLNFGGAATAPVFTTAAATNIYFNKGFTNNTNALTFNATSNTYFSGNGSITPNAAITFGHVQISAGATDTLASGAGAVIVKNFTLNSASSLKLNQNLQVDGNWTNNGGTLNGGSNTIILNATAGTIGGTASTAFPNLQIGVAATAVSVTMNTNNTCADLTFNSSTVARTLTLGVADTLAVSGNITINQPGAAVTSQLAVNAGVCTVAGNLVFSGTNATATWIGRVTVTTGTFNLAGTVTWMSNAAVATEVISVTTGTLIFGSSVTMGSNSGTITATGAATIRFNGATAPSLNFGGAATAPVFTTAASTNIYFNKGFTNNTNALTFNATSNAYFSGNGSITPNAAITFGYVQIAAGVTDTLAAGAGAVITANDFTLQSGSAFKANKDFEVRGNWTNNGGTFDGGNSTITFNGLTKTIGGTAATTFYNVQLGSTAVTLNYTVNQNLTCNNLTFTANTTARSLTLSNGIVLTVNGDLTINQPTANTITNLLAVNAGTCSVAGNLIFTGTSATTSRIARIATTSGTFSLTGSITWMANTVSATEVITTATGTLNFGSSVTMGSASGTISVTSTGNINFNGTAAPSLNFGGTTAPVLTTTAGSFISFNKGLTTATTTLTFATGSNTIFNGTGTITAGSTTTFGNLQINSGYTITAAGNISVTGSWANSGTFVPGTNTVTFSGAGAKPISRNGGETFYNLTFATAGSTVQLLNDVLVTNLLTMSGGNIDLNANTLTLGNNAGASLTYTAGRAYGGTFKRWFPATAITSTSGSFYGLFPIGTSTQYRPVTINSTANPTTAGYVMATHTDVAGATAVTYTDNQGVAIQQIANMHSDLTTSGLAGGTYSLDVKFTDLGTTGALANLRLITYTASTLGSYGTHAATTSSVAAPLARRTGLTVSNLNNAWVVSTTNKAATPLFNYVYSRKASGNWNDASATGTWSLTPGGAGAPCSCVPTSSGYATISAGQTVTVTASDSVKFLDIASTGALLVNAATTLNVVNNMTMLGSSTFTNNGTIKVDNELRLSSAVSPTVNNNVQVVGQLTLPTGTAYTQSAGTLTVNGELSLSGALNIASGASFVFDGSGAHLSGTGTFTTAAGGSFPVTNSKVVEAGTAITIGTSGTNTDLAIGANSTVSNQGSITINGNLTGATSTSIWENYANSTLSVTGAILSTGVLDASTAPNTVTYAGSGAQTIKVPASTYNILSATNAGTKTLAGSIIVDNALTLGGSVVLDESTNSISGTGNLNMSGTSELILSRSVAATYPELTGTYTCTGGTVTLNQTAANCVVAPKNFYNLKLNGTTPYDLSGVSSIANNLDILNTAYLSDNNVLTVGGTLTYATSATTTLQDSIAVNGIVLTSGTLEDGSNSINVFGTGGWSKASGATFTPTAGTVYFSGSGAQTLGGTSASQTFANLCINKSSNSVTVGGSTTALTLNGNMILNGGSFDKGTAATINMTAGDWINNGGTFTPGTGTVVFNAANDQAIRGLATTENFNNLTINDPGFKVAADDNIVTLNISGDITLSAGTLDAGSANNINMTGGNWTSNGATFLPGSSLVTFNSAGAQAINGTDTTQYFHSITVNKSANSLSIGGSTTALVLSGNHTITSGNFNIGTAANMYVAGDWTMTGGTFTNTGSTVTMNGASTQNISSTGAFNNLKVDNAPGYTNLTGNITINGLLTFASGIIRTNAHNVILGSAATTAGAGATSYIYGNERINIPNAAAPSRTFEIGDAGKYAPVQIDFAGTTSGSGSITAFTTAGDDADINNSGIKASRSVNRSWTLSNSGVAGFTSYTPVYNFDATDVDAGANTSAFIARKYISNWDTTTVGARTATSLQLSNETTFGKIIIGEMDSLSITTQPTSTFVCTGTSHSISVVTNSTPTPAYKWQRDANTGTFADITSGMDGSIYTNFNTATLNISSVNAINNYKYRVVLSNLNGSLTSDSAIITVRTTPTVSSTTPGAVCDSGTVNLSATASAGSLNWYAAASGGSSLYTGTTFTTPSVSSNTTYYVDATFNGCTTLSRTPVVATVNTTPTITSTTPGAVCDMGTVDLGATASAGSVKWYATSSGGVSIKTGTTFTTLPISTSTVYYVDATYNGCVTPTRTPVTATVSVTPTATVAYQSCAGVDGNTTIRISQINGTAPFTYKLNSGSFNSYDTAHIGNGTTHNLYVQDTYGCTSSATSYTATAVVPTTIATAGSSVTCNCPSAAEGREVYLTNASGELICIINDRGHDLGTITATTYMRPSPVLINNRQGGQDAAMSRSFLLDFTGTNLVPSVQVKFPFTDQELSDLIAAADATPIQSDDIASLTDLGSTQYEGATEDDTYNTSDATMLVYHRQLGNGTILNGKYITISLSSNGEHWLHGNGNGSALPVKLVSFNATANQNEEMVATNWSTALEINNHYFEVERSTDAINFTTVGRVEGAGNSTSLLNYNFNDVKPLNGLSYYRLKQVDFDGAVSYSDIVGVTLGKQSSVVMYPNPTQNEFTIDIANASENTTVSIFDLNGREVFTRAYNQSEPSANKQISIQAKETLSAGLYMVHVATNGTIFKQKLIIN